MKLKYIALLVLVVGAFTAVAAQATAKHRSDKGQRVDRLARIDSDRDSASNRCEKQASLSRHRKDSDRDGRSDGREDSDGDGANNAAESKLRTNCDADNSRLVIDDAEVVSYSAGGGLTLRLENRGIVNAPVAADFRCEQELDDDAPGVADDATAACTTADLTAGTEVDDAVIKDGNFVWIELDAVEYADSDDDDADHADADSDDDADDDADDRDDD